MVATPVGTASLSLLFTILIVCVVFSAFFSGSETGIMTANRYRLKHQAKTGNKSAQRILNLLAHPDKLIGVILIGNNITNVAASSVATLIGLQMAGDSGVAIAAGCSMLPPANCIRAGCIDIVKCIKK